MAEPSSSVIVEEVEAGVTKVILNRPETRNAMNLDLVARLLEVFEDLRNQEHSRVVILTGEGKGFCSGFDLAGYGNEPDDPTEGRVRSDMAMQRHIASLIPAMRSLPQPIIAAVNGAAAGGGLALALGCDLRIASSNASFSATFVRHGLTGCDIATSWTLPRLVGVGRAHEMMLTGRFVGAEEAEQIGLVLRVVEEVDLLRAALKLAREISANAPLGIAQTKRLMWMSLETPSQAVAMELENLSQVLLLQTGDHREARASFLESRGANYKGT